MEGARAQKDRKVVFNPKQMVEVKGRAKLKRLESHKDHGKISKITMIIEIDCEIPALAIGCAAKRKVKCVQPTIEHFVKKTCLAALLADYDGLSDVEDNVAAQFWLVVDRIKTKATK